VILVSGMEMLFVLESNSMSIFMRYALSLFKDLWIWSCFREKSDSLLVAYAFCIQAISIYCIYLRLKIDD
jgi:hypothetical protein